MRKAVWSAAAAIALLCVGSTPAYAQLDTEQITATAVVAARGRITLTGTINFPDTDPFLSANINAAPLAVQALARVAPASPRRCRTEPHHARACAHCNRGYTFR